MKNILFVCTGNICRSPTAEAILRHLLQQHNIANIEVDSAGTHSYHVGEAPDSRAVKIAACRGVDMHNMHARAVTQQDFYHYDLILAMDAGHLDHLMHMRPKDAIAALALFLDYAGKGQQDVPDPYYGTSLHFEEMFNLIEAGAQAMLQKLPK